MLGLAVASYRWIEKPLRKGNWFGKRWKTLVVGGGVLVTVSGGLLALDKPLKRILYSGKEANKSINKPYTFEGEFTKRSARHCHSSESKEYDALSGAVEITQQFLNNCMSGSTHKPIVAFSGDSHSLSMFPISEVIAYKLGFDVFSHSRGACAFPPHGATSRKRCLEVQSSVAKTMLSEMKKEIAVQYL